MKKLIITTIAVVSLIATGSQAFAARYGKSAGRSYQITEGTVVSVNKAKDLFSVKDKDDGRIYGFMAWASDLASLNQGDHVVVTTEKPGAIALKITR